jgi:ribose transport system permease protein
VAEKGLSAPDLEADAAGNHRASSVDESRAASSADERVTARGGAGQLARRFLGLQEAVPLTALIGLVLVISLSHPKFLENTALVANVRAASFVAIVAFGMVFLLAMGEIDLSVGGTFGVAFYVCAQLGGHMDMYLAAVLAVALGAALGLANGLLVLLFRAPVIIVTLGTYSLYAGLVSVISGGNPIGESLPLDSSFFSTLGGQLLGLPVAGWIALVLCVLLTVMLMRSRPGAMVRAVGSNPSAAAFTGIPAGRLRVYLLMLTGALAGLSGVLTLAYTLGGDPSVGVGFELQVIAAAIIGGTAVTGGAGSVPGALIGALIVATIYSGLVFFNVDPLWQNVVTGIVILLAVGSANLVSRRRAERLVRHVD